MFVMLFRVGIVCFPPMLTLVTLKVHEVAEVVMRPLHLQGSIIPCPNLQGRRGGDQAFVSISTKLFTNTC